MKHDPVVSARPAARAATRAGATVLVGAAAVAWFFRFQVANGFVLHFGDRYDGLIEVAILEHWWNWVRGLEAWNAPLWFHPAPDALGYNDAQFATGMLYALFRAAGCGMIGAAEGAHACLKLLGFFGMHALLRRAARLRSGWALWGAALFTVADLPLQHANHGQLFTLGFAPWAMLTAWRFAREAVRPDGRPLGPGLALAALFALWIGTAYYLAWFFALFAGAAALVALVDADRRAAAARAVWGHRRALAVVIGAAAVMLAPFLLTYLPKARETGMHGYAYLRGSLPPPLELLNAGPHNLVWGWAARGLGLAANHDFVFGLPWALVAVFLIGAVRLRRAPARAPALASAGAAALICWALMLSLGSLSLWWFVFHLVPGAAGVRVVARFQLLLLVPVVAIAAYTLARLERRALAVALAGLLTLEQVATAAPLELRSDELEDLFAGLPSPPAWCRSFAVVSGRPLPYVPRDPDNDAVFPHNVDAMILAERFHRPTVNGFSTFTPPGWDFGNADKADYPARVRRYAARYGLRDVCILDRVKGRIWEPPM